MKRYIAAFLLGIACALASAYAVFLAFGPVGGVIGGAVIGFTFGIFWTCVGLWLFPEDDR